MKSDREERFLRWAGREFQTRGTDDEKERDAVDWRDVEGTTRSFSEEDRSVRAG